MEIIERLIDLVENTEPEAWEYMQVTFDQAITETNLFENLWSNL